jgi:hypothetical protein
MMAPTFDAATVLRGLGFLTPEEAERLDELEQHTYFLVRIDGQGERWRCRRCNGRHTHFTLFCCERPFRGIGQGLYAYWRNIGAGDPSELSARQVARVGQIGALFGADQPQTNLSTHHPRTAQALGYDAADVDVGADLLGTLDPISEAKARILADLINTRARQNVIRL